MSTLSNMSTFMCMCLAPIAVITYEVFGIIYLVDNYKDMDNSCIKDVWIYILVSLILGITNMGVTKKRGSVTKNIYALFCLILINTVLAVWVGISLAQQSCKTIFDNHLWKFGFATFIIQGSTILLILILVCCEIIATSAESRYNDDIIIPKFFKRCEESISS